VHRFKYTNEWLTSYNLGRWLGILMRQRGNFDDVDVIIPVPLHWWRRLSRGYNQSEYIARGIAKSLGCKVLTHAVRRHHYNRTQTSQSATERWNNVEGIFRVTQPKRLQGRHILLVDDVFTTGATIMSLGETILKAVDNCQLSVATLAITRQSLRQMQ
jgi:ComF family protein